MGDEVHEGGGSIVGCVLYLNSGGREGKGLKMKKGNKIK